MAAVAVELSAGCAIFIYLEMLWQLLLLSRLQVVVLGHVLRRELAPLLGLWLCLLLRHVSRQLLSLNYYQIPFLPID